MRVIYLFLVQLLMVTALCQSDPEFQSSGFCQRNNNVNCNPKFEHNIRATFRILVPALVGENSWCTGTFINRDVSQGELGYYFISARHCIFNNIVNQGVDADLSKEFTFYFNYQSPDCNDESIPEFKSLFT